MIALRKTRLAAATFALLLAAAVVPQAVKADTLTLSIGTSVNGHRHCHWEWHHHHRVQVCRWYR